MATGSKKWFWLAIPLGVLSVPFLPFAMMIGSRLVAMLIGPVNVWNMTTHAPSPSDLAGDYEPDRNGARYLPSGVQLPAGSHFRLGADHRADVTDLPAYDGFGEPLGWNYSGNGDWTLSEGAQVTLIIYIRGDPTPTIAGDAPSGSSVALGGFELLGHSPPYAIWYGIGDPDEGQGLIYVRRHP
jgi:hypothetical protein